jgi:hypothetical protein
MSETDLIGTNSGKKQGKTNGHRLIHENKDECKLLLSKDDIGISGSLVLLMKFQ